MDRIDITIILYMFMIVSTIAAIAGFIQAPSSNLHLDITYSSNLSSPPTYLTNYLPDYYINLTPLIFYANECLPSSYCSSGSYNVRSKITKITTNRTVKRVIETFIHERGHYFWYEELTDSEITEWKKLYSIGPIDDYAAENGISEDFADSYAIVSSGIITFEIKNISYLDSRKKEIETIFKNHPIMDVRNNLRKGGYFG